MSAGLARSLWALSVLMLALPALAGAQVSMSLQQSSVEVYFDKPKQEADYFYEYVLLELRNENNESTAYVNIVAWLEGEAKEDAGITAFAEKKGKYELAPSESREVKIYLKVPSGAPQGSYSARLKLSGNYTYDGSTYTTLSGTYSLNVEVAYPPAMLEVLWEGKNDDWGYLKAGKLVVKKLWIGETFGYRGVNNLKLRIKATGDVVVEYPEEVGNLEAGKWKSVEVKLRLPERGLVPGKYSVTPEVSASTWFKLKKVEVANYSVAKPAMSVSKEAIDFGKLSFWEGRDSATVGVWVSETSGYTPIEGLRISLAEGERGWVSWSRVEYVPAGGARLVNFTVTLPPYATLGERWWRFRVDTEYAGSAEISARVQVYFPGLEEAQRKLANLSAGEELKPVLASLSALMEDAKGLSDAREIALVMGVYSGFYSGVEHLSAGRMVAAGRAVQRAYTAASGISDEGLRGRALEVAEALRSAWRERARSGASELEAELPEASFLERADIYGRLSALYSLLGDDSRASEYAELQEEALAEYRERVRVASELLVGAQRDIEAGERGSMRVGGRLLLVNPFSYDEAVEGYEGGIEKLRKAAGMLREAGEVGEADKAEFRAEELESSLEGARRLAWVWFGLLGLGYVALIGRTCLALLRWVEDSRELREGVLLVQDEAGEG